MILYRTQGALSYDTRNEPKGAISLIKPGGRIHAEDCGPMVVVPLVRHETSRVLGSKRDCETVDDQRGCKCYLTLDQRRVKRSTTMVESRFDLGSSLGRQTEISAYSKIPGFVGVRAVGGDVFYWPSYLSLTGAGFPTINYKQPAATMAPPIANDYHHENTDGKHIMGFALSNLIFKLRHKLYMKCGKKVVRLLLKNLIFERNLQNHIIINFNFREKKEIYRTQILTMKGIVVTNMQTDWEHRYDETSTCLQCLAGHGKLFTVVLIFSILNIDPKFTG
ncbi:hypothetical protein V1478_000270 [Vespula squamosa]|uniref:Uncharacterized protein n=1 Tax=Vespula squamosa TaxID=30214 RepID=A0ABD2C5W9_VESSQ